MEQNLFCAYVDGGCPNNGRQAHTMFGSYIIYDISYMEYDLDSDNFHYEVMEDLEPLTENLRFPLNLTKTPQEVEYIPKKTTNNTAEALSLLCLLVELNNKGLLSPGNKIIIFMDSELTLYQVKGIYKVKQPHLKRIHTQIHNILDSAANRYHCRPLDFIDLRWISGDTMKATKIMH